MAGVPPLSQSYLPIFESYWQQLEGSSRGEVNALTAANFLKKSQLKEQLLHKIWDLSDPRGKGYLDKQGFFIALRLVAACQCGRDVALSSIQMPDPPPKFVGVDQTVWTIDRLQPVNGLLSGDKIKSVLVTTQLPLEVLGKIWHLSDIDRDGSLDADEFAVAMKLVSLCQKGEALPLTLPHSLVPATKAARIGIAPPATILPSPDPTKKTPTSDWVITPEIQTKYDTYFEGIDKDRDGIVSGEEARGILMSSNLPHAVLAHVWNLCDTSKTGKLNKQQFALAMYLIAEKVKGRELPKELPPHLIPPSQRSPSPVTSIKAGVRNVRTPPNISPSPSDLLQTSHSSGNILLPTSSTSTSVPNAFPSNMSTTSLPLTLSSSSPSLLQPSSSTSTIPLVPSSSGGILQPTSTAGNILQPSSASQPSATAALGDFGDNFSAIKELDGITGEIESIRKEKQSLQQDVSAKQELLQKGRQEVTTLSAELEESTRQRDQLEKQKKETQAQIEEIDNQRSKMESDINEVKRKCEEEREEIQKLRGKLRECEEDKSQQQQQLQKLQQTLQELQKEESGLKTRVESSCNELLKIKSDSRTMDDSIGQVQNHIDQLRVEQDQYTAQIASLSPQIASLSPSTESNSIISELPEGLTAPNLGEHDAISARATAGSSSPVSSISGFSGMSHPEEERDRTETLTTMNIPTLPHDPFSSFTDPFTNASSGASASEESGTTFDPFGVFKSDTSLPTSSNDVLPFAAFTTTPFSTTTAASTSATTTTTNTSFANFTNMANSTASTTSDPFTSSDPFVLAATPKATNQSTWSGSGGFDPFASQGSTDPFASTDLFGGDPFGGNNPFSSNTTTNNSSGFGTDPFAAPP